VFTWDHQQSLAEAKKGLPLQNLARRYPSVKILSVEILFFQ
jgi:hypothetical protein